MARQRRTAIAKMKLQLEAGRATPAPPVGRDLGPHGVNLLELCKGYDGANAGQEGRIFPAVVTIHEDRFHGMRFKPPLMSSLLGDAAGVKKSAASPNSKPVSVMEPDQLRRSAETKMPDLNAGSVEASMQAVQDDNTCPSV